MFAFPVADKRDEESQAVRLELKQHCREIQYFCLPSVSVNNNKIINKQMSTIRAARPRTELELKYSTRKIFPEMELRNDIKLFRRVLYVYRNKIESGVAERRRDCST